MEYRSFGLDVGRLAAILLVISLHIIAPAFSPMRDDWVSVDVFMSFSRICVPVFFMMSGALLLGRIDGPRDYVRRLLKIIIPTIVWAGVYLLWADRYHEHKTITSLWDVYSRLPYFHFWFVYEIVGLYLLLPALRAIVQTRPLAAGSFLMLWMIFGSVLPILRFTGTDLPDPAFNVRCFQGYTGVFLIGYFLSLNDYSTRARLLGLVTYVMFSIAIAFATYHHAMKIGVPDQTPFYIYTSPWVLLASVGAFVFLRQLHAPNRTIARAVQLLADGAFSVYFAHMILIETLQLGLFTGYPLSYNTGGTLWIGTPMLTLFVFGICFLLLYPVRKFRPLRYLVG